MSTPEVAMEPADFPKGQPPSLSEPLVRLKSEGMHNFISWIQNAVRDLAANVEAQRERQTASEERLRLDTRQLRERLCALEARATAVETRSYSQTSSPRRSRLNTASETGEGLAASRLGGDEADPDSGAAMPVDVERRVDAAFDELSGRIDELELRVSGVPGCEMQAPVAGDASTPTPMSRVSSMPMLDPRQYAERLRHLEEALDNYQERHVRQANTQEDLVAMRLETVEVELTACVRAADLDALKQELIGRKARNDHDLQDVVTRMGQEFRTELQRKADLLQADLRAASSMLQRAAPVPREPVLGHGDAEAEASLEGRLVELEDCVGTLTQRVDAMFENIVSDRRPSQTMLNAKEGKHAQKGPPRPEVRKDVEEVDLGNGTDDVAATGEAPGRHSSNQRVMDTHHGADGASGSPAIRSQKTDAVDPLVSGRLGQVEDRVNALAQEMRELQDAQRDSRVGNALQGASEDQLQQVMAGIQDARKDGSTALAEVKLLQEEMRKLGAEAAATAPKSNEIDALRSRATTLDGKVAELEDRRVGPAAGQRSSAENSHDSASTTGAPQRPEHQDVDAQAHTPRTRRKLSELIDDPLEDPPRGTDSVASSSRSRTGAACRDREPEDDSSAGQSRPSLPGHGYPMSHEHAATSGENADPRVAELGGRIDRLENRLESLASQRPGIERSRSTAPDASTRTESVKQSKSTNPESADRVVDGRAGNADARTNDGAAQSAAALAAATTVAEAVTAIDARTAAVEGRTDDLRASQDELADVVRQLQDRMRSLQSPGSSNNSRDGTGGHVSGGADPGASAPPTAGHISSVTAGAAKAVEAVAAVRARADELARHYEDGPDGGVGCGDATSEHGPADGEASMDVRFATLEGRVNALAESLDGLIRSQREAASLRQAETGGPVQPTGSTGGSDEGMSPSASRIKHLGLSPLSAGLISASDIPPPMHSPMSGDQQRRAVMSPSVLGAIESRQTEMARELRKLAGDLQRAQGSMGKSGGSELSEKAISELDAHVERRMTAVWNELTQHAKAAAVRADALEKNLKAQIDKQGTQLATVLKDSESRTKDKEQISALTKQIEWLNWRVSWLEWATVGEKRGFSRTTVPEQVAPRAPGSRPQDFKMVPPSQTVAATSFAQPMTEDMELWAREPGSRLRQRRPLRTPLMSGQREVDGNGPGTMMADGVHGASLQGSRSTGRLPSLVG
mmetsp:Transcript_82944/g.231362  ORF Transcript_82944/g.231362 Transcript_82944/m.231362 type:complete len:1204 (-) Transcript_82944:64-3675(-)